MKEKREYTAPTVKVIRLLTDEDNLAQLPISSHPIGEDEGLSKKGFFDEEEEMDDEEETNIWF